MRQLASFSRIFLISWPQRGFILLFDGRPRDRCFVLRYAGEHAQHVPVDRRLRRVKADGRYRARRIIPHAGQRPDGSVVPRELAAVLRHNDAGGLLQIAHAGIIAQALPQLRQAVFFAGCKRGDIGQLR